MKSVISATVD